jgi:deazaflavin-dependent oxidoreductase (nitroreductase family)
VGTALTWIPGHVDLYLKDPEAAHIWGRDCVPTLLLTTIGRTSGEPRHSPMIYGHVGDSDSYVVIASKGGNDTHPAWYLNLMANPEAEVRVALKRFRAAARTLHGEERAKMWAHMCRIYPSYIEYQTRTEREIPVVVLEPIDD